MLFEIRMSPQLHRWLYGYYPFGFITQMRYGGFRPSVFMENGLVCAFFAMTAMVAATAFGEHEPAYGNCLLPESRPISAWSWCSVRAWAL